LSIISQTCSYRGNLFKGQTKETVEKLTI